MIRVELPELGPINFTANNRKAELQRVRTERDAELYRRVDVALLELADKRGLDKATLIPLMWDLIELVPQSQRGRTPKHNWMDILFKVGAQHAYVDSLHTACDLAQVNYQTFDGYKKKHPAEWEAVVTASRERRKRGTDPRKDIDDRLRATSLKLFGVPKAVFR